MIVDMNTFFRKLISVTTETAAVDWDAVYADALPRVFHYFCYRVSDTQNAEDLTAVTFEKAWRARCRYSSERGTPVCWLMGIARHVAMDYFRTLTTEAELDENLPDPQPSGSFTELIRQEIFAKIHTLVSQLPERDQELIALKYGADLTNREIAALTDLSETNVGTVLHRCLSRLRKERNDDDDE